MRSDERDKQLTQVRWKVGTKEYYLNRCTADSQLWRIEEVAPTDRQQKMHGIMVVYVDDFLLQSHDGPIRSGLLKALKEIWKLDKEVTLSTTQGLTFLRIDMVLRKNGDVFLHQERFVDSILEKYSYQACKGNKCVQIDKLPIDDDVPAMAKLRELQSYSGEFNWLATRTFLPHLITSIVMHQVCNLE